MQKILDLFQVELYDKIFLAKCKVIEVLGSMESFEIKDKLKKLNDPVSYVKEKLNLQLSD